MKITTHQEINHHLCGTPVSISPDHSTIQLVTDESMKVDKTGLVHGGFIFGLADHAAMLAVNHPNVVLGGADVKFLKPVKAGETVVAEATITSKQGRKHIASVTAYCNNKKVFSGEFSCFVLEKHVLG